MTEDRPRDEGGKWEQSYTTEDVLDVIRTHEGSVTTGTIVEALGCSHDTARRRLTQLYEDGVLEREKVATAYAYRIVGDSREDSEP